MRVLLTHHYFPPDFAGGGEYVVLETARGLIERGVDVQVLTTGDPRVREFQGVPTTRLPIHRYRFNLAFRRILEMARGVDLIQTFNYHACLPSLAAGRQLNKPVVCFILSLCQDAWSHLRTPVLGPLWAFWEKFTLTRGFSRVVFASEHSRNAGVRLGVPAGRSVVNCPGIDLASYASAPEKEDVVFFTGRLDRRRGVDLVLATAEALPHVRFRVMGWGPMAPRLAAVAPPNVEVLPFERGAPLRRAFASARIFFLPSRSETFGIALVEAMASGCAIVSSAPVEFEGIRIGTNPAEMAAAVDRLWRDPGATALMGRSNIELARQYNWERFTDATLATYAEVLGGA
jgi:glycosyltransferase involved in cell wall biosynthesis